MSADGAPAAVDDQVEAWARAGAEARMRLMQKFNHGPGPLAIVIAVVDAPSTRSMWLEGGSFADIYRNDPAEIERRLAQYPELTADDVLDAWKVLDDAIEEALGLAAGLRVRARELGLDDKQPLGAIDAVRGLRRLVQRRRDIDDDERRFIEAARAAGVTWEEIGETLGFAPASARQNAYRRARALGLSHLFLKRKKGGDGDGS